MSSTTQRLYLRKVLVFKNEHFKMNNRTEKWGSLLAKLSNKLEQEKKRSREEAQNLPKYYQALEEAANSFDIEEIETRLLEIIGSNINSTKDSDCSTKFKVLHL